MATKTLLAAPDVEPLSLAEAQDALRLTTDDDAATVASLIVSARRALEHAAKRVFCSQTWQMTFDAFRDPLELPVQPVASITSIAYLDAAGVWQTLDPSVYELGQLRGIHVVRLAYNQTWPATRDHKDVVRVEAVCGYGTAAAVPEEIRDAMRLVLIERYYGQGEIPKQAEWLIEPYRVRRAK